MVVDITRPNNGLSGSDLPPPATPPNIAADRLAEKLKLMDQWSAQRDHRQGPLCARWYREQDTWGAQKNTRVAHPWAGAGPFRGAKGAGRICFGTGIAPSDLSCNEVLRQQLPGQSYHKAIPVPTPFRGRRPDYASFSNETLREPLSPPSSPPRRELPIGPPAQPTLPWKHELWGKPDRFGTCPPLGALKLSPSGEGMALPQDITPTGLSRRVHTAAAPRADWTVQRPLASPDREERRLRTLQIRTRSGARSSLIPSMREGGVPNSRGGMSRGGMSRGVSRGMMMSGVF